jgi:DNA-directed RNA polymerase subunit beta'
MSEEEYLQAQDEYGGDSFTAMIGAEAIRKLLMRSRSAGLREQLRVENGRGKTELKPKKLAKRIKLIDAFLNSGNKS